MLLAARLMSIIRKVIVRPIDGHTYEKKSEHVYFLGICVKATFYKYDIEIGHPSASLTNSQPFRQSSKESEIFVGS